MKKIGGWLLQTFSKSSTSWLLLGLNLLVTAGIMWSTRNVVLADAWSYIGLANGILHGEYSMWWHLAEDYPDTVRVPGFPLLIAGVMALFGSWKAMVGVNVLLYAIALYCTRAVILRLDGRVLTWNLFLLLLLPMIFIPYYITQVYTEVPVLALISVALYIGIRPGPLRWPWALALGLVFGCAFQLKPVLLLLPALYAACRWWQGRSWAEARGMLLMLVVFGATLVPYGLWNRARHGVFKITPLEGGAGVMHFGLWAGKLPGYTEKAYWHNFAGDELVRFTPEEEIPANIAAYEQEWNEVNARIAPLLTAHDSVLFTDTVKAPFPSMRTLNAEYTILRDRLLVERTVDLATSDPLYTALFKAYSAIRFWVIGIQRGDLAGASLAGRVQMLYATGITLLVFLATLIVVPLAFRRGLIAWSGTWQLLFYMLYFGLLHLPFAIQARYTVPVRFAMFALLAMAIAGFWEGRKAHVDVLQATRKV